MAEKEIQATAFQASNAEGSEHVVGIGNLRVLITQEEEHCWIAQGLEIDYFAEGATIEAVKVSFEDGLTATIREHLKVYGTIENILQVAPQEAWRALMAAKTCHRHSQISEHRVDLPFDAIQYFQPEEQAA